MPVNLPIIRTSLSPADVAGRAVSEASSIYIHVPFCETKCAYCDFYSLPQQSADTMGRYTQAVLREASWWSEAVRSPIATVFFGGGTPTVLPRDLMRELIRGLRQLFRFSPDVEWTTEANPATLDRDYCVMLRDEGVNRVSIGAQSFVDSELRSINRIHSAAAIPRTIEAARNAGFVNLSLDLMYALPEQTPETWDHSLRSATSLSIKHVSAYCLTLEENTPMWAAVNAGRLAQPGEAQQIAFVQRTREYLAHAGLPPYEVSNFAAPGYECRHNQMYWRPGNYIGLGPAAASHMGNRRWRNVANVATYVDEVLTNSATPITDDEFLSPEQQAIEAVMLSLRTRDGLGMELVKHLTGADMSRFSSVERLSQLGLVYCEGNAMHLTERGILVADEVIREVVRGLG